MIQVAREPRCFPVTQFGWAAVPFRNHRFNALGRCERCGAGRPGMTAKEKRRLKKEEKHGAK